MYLSSGTLSFFPARYDKRMTKESAFVLHGPVSFQLFKLFLTFHRFSKTLVSLTMIILEKMNMVITLAVGLLLELPGLK